MCVYVYDLMLHIWSGTIYGECLHVPEVEYVPKLGAVCRSLSGNALAPFYKKGPFGLIVKDQKADSSLGRHLNITRAPFRFNKLF